MPTPDTTPVRATTNHETIRRWTEARDGRPARVRILSIAGSGPDVGGILRIDFWDDHRILEPISWETFFTVFDYRRFSFLYQERMDGRQSLFYSIVGREPTDKHPDPVREALAAANQGLSNDTEGLAETEREMDEDRPRHRI